MKIRDKLRYSDRISSSCCSTRNTRRVTLIKNRVINRGIWYCCICFKNKIPLQHFQYGVSLFFSYFLRSKYLMTLYSCLFFRQLYITYLMSTIILRICHDIYLGKFSFISNLTFEVILCTASTWYYCCKIHNKLVAYYCLINN